MPYQKFRKLFEQRHEPSRWQRITLGSSMKWALAGGLCIIAVCCWRGEAEPIPKPHLRISPRKAQIRHFIYAIRAISAVTLEAQLALISIPSECGFSNTLSVRQVLDLVFGDRHRLLRVLLAD
jgi:hypothetical protein